ncbi:MAG TPA: tripartite tricarboxylate transporter substrate-binding protein [Alicycliphilus sp.]|nr:tripartite tricarboxylate transporter substrate-binding protein [Alicycliphilus sp.]
MPQEGAAAQVQSVARALAVLKAHPGAVNFASAGVGGLAHLGTELFKRAAGIDARHVPYKGTIRVVGVTGTSPSPAYKVIPLIAARRACPASSTRRSTPSMLRRARRRRSSPGLARRCRGWRPTRRSTTGCRPRAWTCT